MFRTITASLVLASSLAITGTALAQSLNTQIRTSLGQTIPNVTFTNVTLREAIDFLSDVANVNVQVQWKALEQAGVMPDTTINLRLRNVPLRKVLTMILDQVAGGPTLTYFIDDGVIEITTRQIADQNMVTRVYPVLDLLAEPPDFIVPDISMADGARNQTTRSSNRTTPTNDSGRYQSPTSATGNTGNGNTLFPGAANTQVRDLNTRAQQLISLIKDIVQPDAWRDTGTGTASIQFFNGSLVVTASRSIHEKIGGPID